MNSVVKKGSVFSHLLVLSDATRINGKLYVDVRCSCGAEKKARVDHIAAGKTLSCGCFRAKLASNRKSHGMSETSEYEIWCSMKKRCFNKNNAAYKNYGGRGISICEKWSTFEGFFEDMGVRPSGTSIDRIDNNKNYSKENCRWADATSQANNRRNVKLFEVNGYQGTMPELCKIFDMPRNTVWVRLRNGWSVIDSFTVAVRKSKVQVCASNI